MSSLASARQRRAMFRSEGSSGTPTARSKLPQGKMTVMRSATAASSVASASSGSAIQIRFGTPPRSAFRPAFHAISMRPAGLVSDAMNKRVGSRDAQWYGPRPSPLPKSM